MNTSRLSAIIAVLVIGGIVAGTWFLGIGPRLSEISNANDERETVEFLNAKHEKTLAQLGAIDVPALEADLVGLRAAFPEAAELPAYYRELHEIGAAHGVSITVAGLTGPTRYAAAEQQVDDAELAAALPAVSPDNFLIYEVSLEIAGPNAAILDTVAALQATKRFGHIYSVGVPESAGDLQATSTAPVMAQIFVMLSQPVPADPAAVPAPAAETDSAEGGETAQ